MYYSVSLLPFIGIFLQFEHKNVGPCFNIKGLEFYFCLEYVFQSINLCPYRLMETLYNRT